MSLSSPQRPSISRSVSPVSTISRTHSAYRRDAQTNGYRRVPDPPQQEGGIEMVVPNVKSPIAENVTNPSAFHDSRPAPELPNKYDTTVNTKEANTVPNRPKLQSKNLPLNRSDKVGDIVSKVWLGEILAYCFSLTCMGAVIGVLAYENGKRLDRWGLKISPNAVVSFIIALAKSSFLLAITETISQLKWLHFHDKSRKLSDLRMFDEASRGPFGSLKLLLAGYRITFLATLAAGVMVAALFVDPFVQLVLSFPSRETLAPTENASFQTAQLYDPNQYILDAHNTAATGMLSAIKATTDLNADEPPQLHP